MINENNVCDICGREHYHVNKRAGSKHQAGYKKLMRRFCVHHKTYRHIGNEQRDELMVLCFSCHEFGHHFEALIQRDPAYIPLYEQWCALSGWQTDNRKGDLQ